MTDHDLSKAMKRIVENEKWICLATVNATGTPETRAMINLGNPQMFPGLKKFYADGFTAYFSTNTSSCKIGQLAINGKSSIYYYHAETFEGLLFLGTVKIIDDPKTKAEFWQDNWTMYYKNGVTDPDYTLLRFIPDSYKYYNGNFQVLTGNILKHTAE